MSRCVAHNIRTNLSRSQGRFSPIIPREFSSSNRLSEVKIELTGAQVTEQILTEHSSINDELPSIDKAVAASELNKIKEHKDSQDEVIKETDTTAAPVSNLLTTAVTAATPAVTAAITATATKNTTTAAAPATAAATVINQSVTAATTSL